MTIFCMKDLDGTFRYYFPSMRNCTQRKYILLKLYANICMLYLCIMREGTTIYTMHMYTQEQVQVFNLIKSNEGNTCFYFLFSKFELAQLDHKNHNERLCLCDLKKNDIVNKSIINEQQKFYTHTLRWVYTNVG